MEDLETARLEAERIARAAEEARRRAVLAEISRLEEERIKYQGLKDSVNSFGSEIDGVLSELEDIKSRDEVLASTEDFECLTADKIASSLEEAQAEIQNNRKAMEDALNEVHIQDRRISAKIEEINLNISSLRATI